MGKFWVSNVQYGDYTGNYIYNIYIIYNNLQLIIYIVYLKFAESRS